MEKRGVIDPEITKPDPNHDNQEPEIKQAEDKLDTSVHNRLVDSLEDKLISKTKKK